MDNKKLFTSAEISAYHKAMDKSNAEIDKKIKAKHSKKKTKTKSK